MPMTQHPRGRVRHSCEQLVDFSACGENKKSHAPRVKGSTVAPFLIVTNIPKNICMTNI